MALNALRQSQESQPCGSSWTSSRRDSIQYLATIELSILPRRCAPSLPQTPNSRPTSPSLSSPQRHPHDISSPSFEPSSTLTTPHPSVPSHRCMTPAQRQQEIVKIWHSYW
ncbi:hypothetical protein E4U57_003065 [Claviceps arundinis]|uniref:Uncharacterized protein n=1 Tax=Claviceps arundinis TaxID=1623583 RepID=A0A9P7MRJ7_9HYPO|nr:hypothetical protein E4U57_003065 [Claviceps arundinis]KAG5966625.1 hypothetical protein E4U56_001210 [Claviceps arundinis]